MFRFKALLAAAATAGALVAFDAEAIIIDSTTSVGDSFSIAFDGNIEETDVEGLTTESTFTFTGLQDFNLGGGETNNAYQFDVMVNNTTDDTLWLDSRASALAFDVDPDIADGSSIGDWQIFVQDSALPNQFGSIEVCVKEAGGPNNCQGGGGGGVSIGETATFTLLLAFNAPPPTEISVDNFGVRYQDLTSNGAINGVTYNGDSGTGTGTSDNGDNGDNGGTDVPEPATLAMLGTGLAGIGWAIRRRRKQVA